MKLLQKVKANYVLIVILFLASALRFYHIDFQSVWLDELITMNECNPALSFKDSYANMIVWENNPLLYYFTVKYISVIFGYSTFVVRMISAIIGISGVYCMYLLGKEISNKKTGLIAAILMCFNAYHIFYSQEARPYGLLTIFTIISFYRLIILLKNNNLKNSIYYGLAATAMINTHFFGLFVLVSQAIIILFFMFDIDKNKIKEYLVFASISGFITIIVWYFLSWDIFKIATKIKAFWIPPPTPELITNIFREFFGYSELLLFTVLILTIYYFIKVMSNNEDTEYRIKNRINTFSFIIIAIWILVTISIPYIRTYLLIPMITGRYLIVLLPAITLLLAISINNIQNKIFQKGIVIIFIIASLTDLIIVKDYYNKVTKTQFREISEVILEKNTSKAKIVSNWFWHFGYYLNEKPNVNSVISSSLQDYVNNLIAKPDGKAFWYVDAHQRPYTLNTDAENFLNNNYNVVENLEFFDTWAKYYVPKSGAADTFILDINKFEPIKSDNSINILLFSNSTTKSLPTLLDAGKYRVAIKAKSLPDPPIKGENGNIAVAISGKEIGAYFTNEKEEKTNYFEFSVDKKKEITVDLTFGNDIVEGTSDRNVLVFSVVIEKIK